MTTVEIFVWNVIGFLMTILKIFLATEILFLLDLRKIQKKKFDNDYPVGSFYETNLKKKKFPYGKWELRGFDQNGSYVFERMK